MQIQLSWQEKSTEKMRSPILNVPIALGREFGDMPGEIAGKQVSRMVLKDSQVSRFHALITWENSSFVVTDQTSRNGVLINGQAKNRSVLANGDVLFIDPYEITISLGVANG
ncbi:MAG: FHA domain-containing protein [Spirulinaceae cyanobacterium]